MIIAPCRSTAAGDGLTKQFTRLQEVRCWQNCMKLSHIALTRINLALLSH